jgi:uncharacterized protein (TIGR03067 family)
MKTNTTTPLAVGLLLAAAVPLSAGDSNDEAVKKEREKYQGVWQVVSLEVDGNKASDEDARKIKVINGVDGGWTLEVDGQVLARGTSKIDPTKKPKTADLTETEGEAQGKTFLGIYEQGDDERKVCYAAPEKERPDDFSAPAGSERFLAVLKRLKK